MRFRGYCTREPLAGVNASKVKKDDSQFLEIFKLGLERVSGEDKDNVADGWF